MTLRHMSLVFGPAVEAISWSAENASDIAHFLWLNVGKN